MTVCKLSDGALFVHSPIAPDAVLLAALRELGCVEHVVAPKAVDLTSIRHSAACSRGPSCADRRDRCSDRTGTRARKGRVKKRKVGRGEAARGGVA